MYKPVTKKILITVKTYPILSTKYDELVCTAGLDEQGNWYRLYPIPFRKIDYDKRYKKYQWIEIKIKKNTRDFRPESYKPIDFDKLKLCEFINTDKGYWRRRKKIVLKKICFDISKLIKEAKNKKICTSLAVFKPKEIIDFKIEEDKREWDQKKIKLLEEKAKQLNLFSTSENPFEIVQKLPYKFSYTFIDKKDVSSTLMIEDWEIGQLYWNCLKRNNGDEKKACEDVKMKYFNDFAKTKDIYLYLGTTRQFHFMAPNPFLIIGTFHPKKDNQLNLFEK